MSRTSLHRVSYLFVAASFTLQCVQPSAWADDPFGSTPKSQSSANNDDPFGGHSESKAADNQQDPFDTSAPPSSKTNTSSLPIFSEAREAAALVFVKKHCPELLVSLDEYRKLNVAGYHQAIRQFFQWSEMSTDGKFQDDGGLDLALRGSQATIDSQLLSAKLMSNPSQIDNLKGDLKKLIESSVDLQIAQATHQIAKVESQLVAMKAQQEVLMSKRDETVAARMSALEKMVAERINLSNIPEDVKDALKNVEEAVRRKAAEGHDVSKFTEGMRHIGTLIREGKTDQALQILQKAEQYLNR